MDRRAFHVSPDVVPRPLHDEGRLVPLPHMAIRWPKNLRVLARKGLEADGVIVDFRLTEGEGVPVSQPVVRVATPEGGERLLSNGLSTTTNEQRGRGDLLHVLLDPVKDVAVVLAEPVSFEDHARRRRESLQSWNPAKMAGLAGGPSIDWGRRTEGVVVSLVPEGAGTRTVVRYGDREQTIGPVVAAPDPRRVGDVVDLGLDASGAIIRAPEAAAGDGAALRAEMAREPSLLRKLWDAV